MSGTWHEIVVGIDGSPASLRAARWAAHVATRSDVPLHLLCADEEEGRRAPASAVDAARERATSALSAATAHLDRVVPEHPPVTTEIAAASARSALVAAVETSALVVVGHDVSRSALGSTATAVAMAGRGVTAVVPSTAEVGTPRHVILAVDPEHDTTELLTYAVEEARVAGCALRVVHGVEHAGLVHVLYDDWGAGEPWKSVVTARISNSLTPLTARAGVPWSLYVREGPAADTVVTQLMPDDLLVLGGRSHTSAAPRLLGSVAARLLTRSPCPVVVVHPRETPGG